jgi:hypothetical protein
MLKPEIVQRLQFLGRKHDLQSLFPHEALSSAAVPHGSNPNKAAVVIQYNTYSFHASGRGA